MRQGPRDQETPGATLRNREVKQTARDPEAEAQEQAEKDRGKGHGEVFRQRKNDQDLSGKLTSHPDPL